MAEKIVRFDSVTSFLAGIRKGPIVGSWYDPDSYDNRDYNWAWHATESQAFELAEKGWRDGAERIAKLSGPVIEQISSRIRKPEPAFTDEGASIDMGRFLEGDPECFVQWHETEVEHPAPGRVVNIIVNLTVSAFFTANQFYAKGASIAILVDCLEHSGRRVNLDAAICVADSQKNPAGCVIRLKSADEPLNLQAIAAVIAHPAFYRHLGFRQWATLRGITPFRSCMSAPDQGDITIGHSSSDVISDPKAWAVEQLRAQGIVFETEPNSL